MKLFVKGGGRFGWTQVAGGSESIYVGFSQAGEYLYGDPL